MKIVIDIDEEIIEHAKEHSEDSNDEWSALRAIENGTPLEKVLEDIKAEIEEIRKNALGFPNWEYAKGLETAWNVIDKHIAERIRNDNTY